jgi:hypothetical protein
VGQERPRANAWVRRIAGRCRGRRGKRERAATPTVCGAIQLLSISFLAEYIGKIFEEVKQRPTFIVTKLLNFDERDASDRVATTPGPTPNGPGRDAPKL